MENGSEFHSMGMLVREKQSNFSDILTTDMFGIGSVAGGGYVCIAKNTIETRHFRISVIVPG